MSLTVASYSILSSCNIAGTSAKQGDKLPPHLPSPPKWSKDEGIDSSEVMSYDMNLRR